MIDKGKRDTPRVQFHSDSSTHPADVVEWAPVGLVWLDLGGRPAFMNPAASEALGIAPGSEGTPSPSILELVHPRTQQALHAPGRPCPLAAALEQSEGSVHFSESFRAVNGSWFPVEVDLKRLPTGTVLCFRDTQRAVLDASELAHADKLRSLGQLTAGIAHEINTPSQYVGDNMMFLCDALAEICPILERMSELVTRLKSGSIPVELVSDMDRAMARADLSFLLEEVPKAIQESLHGVRTVGELVRAMREFSHPGAPEKTPTDLNHSLETTLLVSRNEWRYVASVATDLDPALPAVSCLAGEMQQAFLNLIVNAAQAIAERKERGEIEGGHITVTTRTDQDWVVVRIGDDGGGIPESIRDRVFEPFATTKPVGKGTGQGLSIARAVVEKHGGDLRFETRSGDGTVFELRIPVETEA